MRRFFALIVVFVGILVVLAVIGGNLPQGNPLHDSTGWLRDFGEKFADGFGGGYLPTNG